MKRSHRYNHNVRLWTAKLAILGQLDKPPFGFEEVVARHFKEKASPILKQLEAWCEEAAGTGGGMGGVQKRVAGELERCIEAYKEHPLVKPHL